MLSGVVPLDGLFLATSAEFQVLEVLSVPTEILH